MKIYFKKLEEFMEENALNFRDLQKETGVYASTFTRMRDRGTASEVVIRKVRDTYGIELQKKPEKPRSVA